MILNRNEKIALVHVAKKATGLTDAEYRDLLSGAAGIESLKDMKHENQFKDIMRAFKKLGFKSINAGKSHPQWTEVWGGTVEQRKKIEVLWRYCARDKSDKALKKFIKRITGVDSPRFLTVDLARKVILALEQMMKKVEGMNYEKT